MADAMIRWNPNFVVREYQSRGLPHKLTGMTIDGISEQRPDPDSRITLSSVTDPLGVPKARVCWRIDAEARRSLVRLGQLLAAELPRAGLPAPVLEEWVALERPEDAVIIDMGHTLGTTRMSEDPRLGVVDARCRVHGVAGLYVAGGSVFPTSGHANPTLMILALAIRLADQIKTDLSR
jgi:choline dehydrogenase-like flavoprotein